MSAAITGGHAMGDDDTPEVERFRPTSGRITGWLTVAAAVAVAGIGTAYLGEGFPSWVVAAAVLVGVLAWASMLRPALWVRDRDVLVMRNMLDTVHVRLAAVEELALRQVLAVRAGDRRWVSAVVGRSWRKTLTSGRRPAPAATDPAVRVVYADFVEERLRRLVDDARDAAGVRPGSPEQLALPDAVRRERAWLPLALVLLAVLGLLLTLVL
jgi:hypothetical protein